MELKDSLATLNEQQRQAVTFEAAPLLVLAGPGSGKTRIIVHRITWLVAQQKTPPEQILAVTFTNRAAEEMRERLFELLGERAEGVWIHTFHAAAMRILRKHGHHIGIPSDFVILDEDEQRLQIANRLRELGVSREQWPVGMIAARIGQMKSQLLAPEQQGETDDPALTAVIRAYEAWLQAHRALDFDDLIRYAVQLLRQESAVRDFYHQTLQHILVDEYQDINKAQYHLLTLLAPPHSDITAVADDDQTIYGWRGSDPSFIDAFIKHYSPAIIKLPYSYRCPPSILYGAQHLIAREDKAEARRRFMQSKAPDNQTPIYHYIFRNIHQEQRWLVTLLKKLTTERGYKPGDIAILYRTHRLARPAEQALLEAGFTVQRVQPKSFFQRHQAREITRYLQMARAITENDIASVINFPVHQVDELSMVQLRRLAQTQHISLVDLLRRIDDFPEVSPLTRHHLRRMHQLATQQLPSLESDAAEAVKIIFEQLQTLRSPWRTSDDAPLARLFDATRAPDAVAQIQQALAVGRPLVIAHDNSLDGRIAAFLFRDVLHRYLGIETDTAVESPSALKLFFGDTRPADETDFLAPALTTESGVSQSIWSWRWAQQMLLSYENLAEGRYTVYDVETTGANVRRDELIEIGAQTYEHRRPQGSAFRALIRPQRGYIPKSATRVHGIRYEDVAEAPTIDQVLPDFLDYIGDDTLVGHNIAQFDNRFIDKACGEHLEGRGFYPLYVDTLPLARRLLPEERHYTLEHLSQTLGLHQGAIRHRALDDLRVTADLFYLLSDYLLAGKEREALSAYLPLLALTLPATESAASSSLAPLVDAAARVLAAGSAQSLLEAALDALPAEQALPAQARLTELAQHQPPSTEEDQRWQSLQEAFLQHVEAFRKYGREDSLRAFLDYQALLSNTDTFAHTASEDAITMMTLHNAKGVEYPVIIILGVEDENLPIWRSLNDPEKLAEERRVLYVGITRAKNVAYLFTTNDREDGFYRHPSRFAFEIPPQYIRHFRIFDNGKAQEIKRTSRGKKRRAR